MSNIRKIIIAEVTSVHGLNGNLKISLKYDYSIDLLKKNKIFLNEKSYIVEKVFGYVIDVCIVKFSEINSVEEAQNFKHYSIYAELNNDEHFSAEYIGFSCFRFDEKIGIVCDVLFLNRFEYLDTQDELIDINLIKKIDYISKKIYI